MFAFATENWSAFRKIRRIRTECRTKYKPMWSNCPPGTLPMLMASAVPHKVYETALIWIAKDLLVVITTLLSVASWHGHQLLRWWPQLYTWRPRSSTARLLRQNPMGVVWLLCSCMSSTNTCSYVFSGSEWEWGGQRGRTKQAKAVVCVCARDNLHVLVWLCLHSSLYDSFKTYDCRMV